MAYLVRYRRRAERDIERLAQASTLEWFDDLVAAVESLQKFPERCAFAPESGFRRKGIRQLLFGEGRHLYRILFRIDDVNVQILTIRHSSRQPLAK